MKRLFLGIGLVGLVTVGVLALVVSSTALAQGQTPPTATPTAPTTKGLERGGGPGFGRHIPYGPAGLEAIAKALGMTTDELSAQLWGGRTVAELAEKAGVKLENLQKAVEAANLAALRDSIEQAVTDGQMSREKADWLLEGLDKGYWDGRGFGCGGRGGGPKGFHRGGAPGMGLDAPTSAPLDF